MVEAARRAAVVAVEVVVSQAGQRHILMGVAVAMEAGRACYMPVGHEQLATFKEVRYICVIILLCMCPHTAIYVSSYCCVCMCPHTAICVS